MPFLKSNIVKDSDILEYGRVPPQAIEVEEAVLGVFLLERDAYALNPVNPEIFYRSENQKICETIKEMNGKGLDIDLLTITQYLRDKEKLDECGGIMYITELTGRIVSGLHLQAHIAILKEKFLRRELIRKSHELIMESYKTENDIEEIEILAENLALTALDQSTSSIISFGQVLPEVAERINQNQYDQKSLTGIPGPLSKLNDHMGGSQNGDLTIIAAYPGDGKTSLALDIARESAELDYPVAFYSREMPNIQLVARIVSQTSGISAKRILSEKLFPEEFSPVDSTVQKYGDLPIYFDDKISGNVSMICNSLRKMKLKFDIKMGIVDYIQLCEGEGNSREEKVSNVTRKLKSIAKELGIPIIALSQFNRKNDRTEPPSISTLRESGAIEQDADNVIILWRPGKHLPENSSWDFRGEIFHAPVSREITLIDVAKGRNIGITKFLAIFKEPITKFDDYQPNIVDEFGTPVNFYEKDIDFKQR